MQIQYHENISKNIFVNNNIIYINNYILLFFKIYEMNYILSFSSFIRLKKY